MFNLWYKHGVGKSWVKNLEYSLCITLIDHYSLESQDPTNVLETTHITV